MIGNFTRHSRQGLSDISPAPNTYVRDPDSGGRAKRGGLAEGDIIVGFKIRPYTSIDDLHRALVGAEIGVESALTVIRGTELIELQVVPQELPQRG